MVPQVELERDWNKNKLDKRMNAEVKKKIIDQAKEHIENLGISQNLSAMQIGISPATFSRMMAGKWELIKDAMWRKVAAWVGISLNDNWGIYETQNLATIVDLASHCQSKSLMRAVSGYAGAGKTTSLRFYKRKNPNVFYVSSEEYFTKGLFLRKIALEMGEEASGGIYEVMERIVSGLKSLECPLLIIDEADKLKDPVLGLIKSIFNQTEGEAGILLAGVDYLRDRISKGSFKHKIGYDELFSRIGRTFVGMKKPCKTEVATILEGNGIDDTAYLNEIMNECVDFRQVKAKVELYLYEKEAVNE